MDPIFTDMLDIFHPLSLPFQSKPMYQSLFPLPSASSSESLYWHSVNIFILSLVLLYLDLHLALSLWCHSRCDQTYSVSGFCLPSSLTVNSLAVYRDLSQSQKFNSSSQFNGSPFCGCHECCFSAGCSCLFFSISISFSWRKAYGERVFCSVQVFITLESSLFLTRTWDMTAASSLKLLSTLSL